MTPQVVGHNLRLLEYVFKLLKLIPDVKLHWGQQNPSPLVVQVSFNDGENNTLESKLGKISPFKGIELYFPLSFLTVCHSKINRNIDFISSFCWMHSFNQLESMESNKCLFGQTLIYYEYGLKSKTKCQLKCFWLGCPFRGIYDC